MIKVKELLVSQVAETFDNVVGKIIADLNISKEEFQEKINPVIESLIEKYNETFVQAHIDKNNFSLENFVNNHSKNQKQIIDKNAELFKCFFIYVNSCDIIFDKWTIALKGKRKSKVEGISVALYGIIVRRTEQIVSLLMDGYVDAAMIIWRSLYENAIALLTLLKEDNEELIEKFSNHSFKNSKKKIDSYSKNHKEMKFKPVPNETLEKLEIEEQRIIDKYGKKFIENEFGWADELFPGNQRASLRLLEDRLNLNRYRPYYLLCSEHVHLGFNGFQEFSSGKRIYLPRITQQNMERKKFIDPMQFTISILHDINNALLFEISTDVEYNVNIKMLKELTVRFSNACR